MDNKNVMHIHYEYYFAVKKNEIINLTDRWMELEITMSEISQTQKNKDQMFALIWDS